jgi:hypothetical protein
MTLMIDDQGTLWFKDEPVEAELEAHLAFQLYGLTLAPGQRFGDIAIRGGESGGYPGGTWRAFVLPPPPANRPGGRWVWGYPILSGWGEPQWIFEAEEEEVISVEGYTVASSGGALDL